MITILSIFTFLFLLLCSVYLYGKSWNNSYSSFLFADRSLKIQSTGLAIASHWFWAIAIFVGPTVAYNWGIIGLLWFVIPNALSLLIVSYILYSIRSKYPDGYSLTQYVKENFSSRLSFLYQLEFILVSFAALLLAFTAISKLWIFSTLDQYLNVTTVTFLISLMTLWIAIQGGIRTGIFTGIIQTILWIIFLGITYLLISFSDLSFISYGKNNLTTPFNEVFLKTFAITWFISIIVGATSHGMMWQKSFSMPKENIFPSFLLASSLFAVITFMMGGLGMFAFSNSLSFSSPIDTSQLVSVSYLWGSIGLLIFSVILIGQTSTVIDTSLTYISNLISMEWFKKDNVNLSRIIMVLFTFSAWIISWLNLEIWTILMLMGCVRITMFTPILLHSLGMHIKENITYYSCVIAIIISFTFSYIARAEKLPIYDLYSALSAFFIPLMSITIAKLFRQQPTQK
jgi:Na+/proline symporter